MLLLKVEDIIRFATENGLDRWDWIAITITSATFIISCISLIIASKTLISQKKTEKNTMPIVNIGVQKSLILQLIGQLLKTNYFILTLQYQMEKMNNSVFPSYHFWDFVPKTNKYLFDNLFYNDLDKFKIITNLQNDLTSFNQSISNLRYAVENDSTDLVREFNRFHIGNRKVFMSVINVLRKCLDMSDAEIRILFVYKLFPIKKLQNELRQSFSSKNDFKLIDEAEEHYYENLKKGCDLFYFVDRGLLQDDRLSDELLNSTVYFNLIYFFHTLYAFMVNDVNLNKIESSSSRMAMSFIASQIEHILESSIYRNICFLDYNEYLQIKNSSDMDQKKMDQSKREDIIRKKEQLEIAMRSQNSLNFKYYYYFIYDRNK